MNFNEVFTRGGYRCHSTGDRGRKQARPLICQKTARYINFLSLPLPLDEKDTDPNSGVHSVFRLLCCSELGNLNKLFRIKKKKKTLSGVHFVRNYIFAGKVNFEGSLNDWELGGEGGGRKEREGTGKSEGDAQREREIDRVGGAEALCCTARGALGVRQEKGR